MRISDWSSDVCSSDLRTGIIYAAIDAFSELQELPGGASVPEAATKVNGLTAVDLDGKTFDLKRIQEVFGRTDLVVPHNAKFDRQFCEKSLSFLRGSQDKIGRASCRERVCQYV